ncbi:MAG: ferritin-like domain-containing protein [Polyangiaceae bacterium]|nr:ferritin-like domain-containing protein [Polyangiaceae bacterium]
MASNPFRGRRLARYLLAPLVPAASLPFLLQPVVLGLTGCACPASTATFPISAADHDTLWNRYGNEALPIKECERLCVVEPEGGGGGGEGGAGGDATNLPSEEAFVGISECKLTTIEFDTPAVYCEGTFDCGGAGRRPPGHCSSRERRPHGSIGEHLAAMAALEAASVFAFEHLALELAAHGMHGLSRRARAAAKDEARHARIVTALAETEGATPEIVEAAPPGVRSLEAIAIDNAEEGCVGETFGAALLAFQSRAARRRDIQAAFASITRDEAQHAVFSFDLDDALRARLGPKAMRRADEARAAAIERLHRRAASHRRRPFDELLGLPDGMQMHAIAAHVRDLWSAA